MDDRFLGGDGRPDLEFAVAGGTLTDVKREDGAGNTRSVITVRPDAEGDITIVLTGRATCDLRPNPSPRLAPERRQVGEE